MFSEYMHVYFKYLLPSIMYMANFEPEIVIRSLKLKHVHVNHK